MGQMSCSMFLIPEIPECYAVCASLVETRGKPVTYITAVLRNIGFS
jgi:hypothetical protein